MAFLALTAPSGWSCHPASRVNPRPASPDLGKSGQNIPSQYTSRGDENQNPYAGIRLPNSGANSEPERLSVAEFYIPIFSDECGNFEICVFVFFAGDWAGGSAIVANRLTRKVVRDERASSSSTDLVSTTGFFLAKSEEE